MCDYMQPSVCSCAQKYIDFHHDVMLNRAHLTERMMKERNQQENEKRTFIYLEKKENVEMVWLVAK